MILNSRILHVQDYYIGNSIIILLAIKTMIHIIFLHLIYYFNCYPFTCQLYYSHYVRQKQIFLLKDIKYTGNIQALLNNICVFSFFYEYVFMIIQCTKCTFLIYIIFSPASYSLAQSKYVTCKILILLKNSLYYL